MILLDTHVVVWLYADPALLPIPVQRRLNEEELGLPPLVRLELQYLYDVGKVTVPAQDILAELMPKLEITATDPPSAPLCEVATRMNWTRDPFDRLIAAQVEAAGTPLVTKDRTIRKHLPLAWWADDAEV